MFFRFFRIEPKRELSVLSITERLLVFKLFSLIYVNEQADSDMSKLLTSTVYLRGLGGNNKGFTVDQQLLSY
jgi:hypothetical protein